MAQTKIEAVVFQNSTGDKTTDAQLHTKVFDNKESIIRALKRLGLFWLLALASLPIIGAHWVLVPGFFIAGPIAAIMAYNVREMLDKASGVCPECRESIEIKMEPKELLPKWTYCPQCNNSLHIRHVQQAPASVEQAQE
jgi:uncharacterized protein with PIN domain